MREGSREGFRERLRDRQHLIVALLCAWLVLTSPWIAMYRRVPASATWLDWAHVGTGLAAAALAVTYAATCAAGGRWRQYFPFFGDGLRALAHDLGGLLRGRLPRAEGGGLFALIEGLLLVALLATAATGTVWYFLQGAEAAPLWRQWHACAARGLTALIVLHVVTVATHLVDLIRD